MKTKIISTISINNDFMKSSEAGYKPIPTEAKKSGVNADNAQTLVNWVKEYNLPFHDIMSHPNREYGKFPHINIGSQEHFL